MNKHSHVPNVLEMDKEPVQGESCGVNADVFENEPEYGDDPFWDAVDDAIEDYRTTGEWGWQ